jgi:hypothetical protein
MKIDSKKKKKEWRSNLIGKNHGGWDCKKKNLKKDFRKNK